MKQSVICSAKVAGTATADLLAMLCLYGLSSAATRVSMIKNMRGKSARYIELNNASSVVCRAGKKAKTARMYPDTAL